MREASAFRVFRPSVEGSREGTSRVCRGSRGMSQRLEVGAHLPCSLLQQVVPSKWVEANIGLSPPPLVSVDMLGVNQRSKLQLYIIRTLFPDQLLAAVASSSCFLAQIEEPYRRGTYSPIHIYARNEKGKKPVRETRVCDCDQAVGFK